MNDCENKKGMWWKDLIKLDIIKCKICILCFSLKYINCQHVCILTAFPGGASGKEPAANEMSVRSLSQEDSLEEGMVTPSRIHAWRIPWTEEPGGLQSMGSHGLRHN